MSIHSSLIMVFAVPLFAALIGIVVYIIIDGVVSWFGLSKEVESE